MQCAHKRLPHLHSNKIKSIKLNEKSIKHQSKYKLHVSLSRPHQLRILSPVALCYAHCTSSFGMLFNCYFSPFLSHKNVLHVISYEMASTIFIHQFQFTCLYQKHICNSGAVAIVIFLLLNRLSYILFSVFLVFVGLDHVLYNMYTVYHYYAYCTWQK